MLNQFSRTELILGRDAMKKLSGSRVAVFGIGGVGGYAVEALVRSGVGAVDLIDGDKFSFTNLNRQIYANYKTIGRYKVNVAKERIAEISPRVNVRTYRIFYAPETSGQFDFSDYDYIIDAIDTVEGKIELAVNADKAGTPIISSMGAGNKMDPTALEVTDIYKTSVCPLARIMRTELKKRGIKRLKVVYSKELPMTPIIDITASDSNEVFCYPPIIEKKHTQRRQIPGSNAFVPPVAGLIAASEVIKDLTGVRGNGIGV